MAYYIKRMSDTGICLGYLAAQAPQGTPPWYMIKEDCAVFETKALADAMADDWQTYYTTKGYGYQVVTVKRN